MFVMFDLVSVLLRIVYSCFCIKMYDWELYAFMCT